MENGATEGRGRDCLENLHFEEFFHLPFDEMCCLVDIYNIDKGQIFMMAIGVEEPFDNYS